MKKCEIYKNRHSNQDFPQTCRGSKSVFPVWIRTTENLITHPMKSFRINEWWSNKYDTHNSTINKRRLERRNWWKFYIKQSNKLKQTSLNTQPEPFPRPYTNLRGKKICMSSLYTAHRKFANTYKGNFQDQWNLILSIQTNRSTTNNANTTTKTLKNNTWQVINQRNNNNLYRLNSSSTNKEE